VRGCANGWGLKRVKEGRRIGYAVACFSSKFTRRVLSPGDVINRSHLVWR